MAEFHFGIAFKTHRSIVEVEDWLEQNCEGDWDVALRGMDDSDPAQIKKLVEVYFELEADKLAFRQGFGKH